MSRVRELKEDKGKLYHQLRMLDEKATAEKRSFTSEEKQIWERLNDEINKTEEAIKEEEQRKAVLSGLTADEGKIHAGQFDTDAKASNGDKRAKAFRNFLKGGRNAVTDPAEMRELQLDYDTSGGFLVAPQEFSDKLIIFLNNLVWVRQRATVDQVSNAQSLGIPQWVADPSDSAWTSEIASVSDDSSAQTGKREMVPHLLTKQVKLSYKLLANSSSVENLVADRLAYKFAIGEENAFLNGSGSNQPLGLFTASANGIDTSRDVTCANTTSIGADDVISAKYNIAQQYLNGATWIFHRSAMSQIRKLKDAMGQYLLQPGLADDQFDRLLGHEVLMSEYAPNTFTAGLYVGLFGNLKWYYICDMMKFTIQRVDELYAGTNQVGFIARAYLDGSPVLPQAFSRMILHS